MTIHPSGAANVPLATKLAYGVGGLSDSIKTFGFTTFLLFYYTTVLGLPGAWLGLAMSVGLVWDATVDPLIGHLSDRASPRFGRRHAFMLVGAAVAGASFVAVFNPPPGLSTGALFAWLMVTSLCLRSSNSLFMVPYYALGSEMAADKHERTSISGYRAGAVFAGTLLATGAAFFAFFPTGEAGGTDAKFVAGSYASMGVVFGLAITAFGLVATIGTLGERRRLPPAPPSPAPTPAFGGTILEVVRVRPFGVLVASSALGFMAAALNAALAMHFLTYHAQITANAAVTSYFVGFYAGALTGVAVWVRVARSFEKHRVYAAAMMATALVMTCGYWLVGEGRPFGTGAAALLAAASALAGFFWTASAVIVPSMLADITAQDQGHAGGRRDGIFFGIYSFGQQLSAGLAVLLAGVLVDRFAGLVPGQAEQSSATIERLVMISNLLPAAMFAAAAAIVIRYPLTVAGTGGVEDRLTVPVEGPQVSTEGA
jgi:glycoside/pentoside/hexuronide:cation symporter, GPH family